MRANLYLMDKWLKSFEFSVSVWGKQRAAVRACGARCTDLFQKGKVLGVFAATGKVYNRRPSDFNLQAVFFFFFPLRREPAMLARRLTSKKQRLINILSKVNICPKSFIPASTDCKV
ncbi:hypothetical protein FKG94_16670 [Exilibacterium tricleocarpae]|uniref:Uncharacterized protein n=1 Tax=Exilibacterium tricleocarpae TaxID=2591008 RepID=A0A545TAK7_9GAMM|nr:hypothetical protein [Exilibacterium tricleocarpae]TQV74238.1 hypothetical protein FKG94_16670 [Exilibacterium tricleocarpae]